MLENKKYFANEQCAIQWMYKVVDDPCIDNVRFAYCDDDAAVINYKSMEESGCCGFFDKEIVVNKRKAMIGCNYGH